MNRLSRAVIALVVPMLAFGAAEVAAQQVQPTNPTRPVIPTNALAPWANPIMSSYQRQRELREQQALERKIQDLQRLELLKAGRAAELEAKDQPKAKSSVTYSKSTTTKSLPPTTTSDNVVAASGKMDKVDSKDVPKKDKVGYAKTYSNYKDLLKK
jgi:hypothetical protein